MIRCSDAEGECDEDTVSEQLDDVTGNLITINPDTTLPETDQLMKEKRDPRLPVLGSSRTRRRSHRYGKPRTQQSRARLLRQRRRKCAARGGSTDADCPVSMGDCELKGV